MCLRKRKVVNKLPIQARIPGIQIRFDTLDAKPDDEYTLAIQWHETDPMVVLMHLLRTNYEHLAKNPNAWWRVGRTLLTDAALSNKHAGLGDVRVGPLTTETTLMHLIGHDTNTKQRQEIFVSIPTRPLRHFIVQTLTKVNPLEEARTLSRYIDSWLSRVQEKQND